MFMKKTENFEPNCITHLGPNAFSQKIFIFNEKNVHHFFFVVFFSCDRAICTRFCFNCQIHLIVVEARPTE